jgi:hypothetical protein
MSNRAIPQQVLGRRRTSRRRTRVVGVVALAAMLLVAGLAWVYVVDTRGSLTLVEAASGVALLVSLCAFVLSGAVILARRPGNPIGLLLIIPGIAPAIAELSSHWMASIQPPPSELTPLLWLLLWLTSFSWVFLVFPIFHLLLVFPSGALLSRRWRLAVVLEVALIATLAVFGAFGSEMGPLVDDVPVWTVPNPVGFLVDDPMDSPFGLLWGLGLLAITVLSAAAIVLRYRRGTRDERLQVKWPLLGALVFAVIYGGASVDPLVPGAAAVAQALLGLALAVIPISVAIAVLRYRLYEIDRIVSRTIGWALATGILLLTFGVLVVGLQGVVANFTGGQTLAVALSTLVAAALFQPVRRRVQRAVDRRFDRARYDGERVVAAFGERLRDHVDLEALSAEVRQVANETVRPAGSALWLRTATDRANRSGS